MWFRVRAGSTHKYAALHHDPKHSFKKPPQPVRYSVRTLVALRKRYGGPDENEPSIHELDLSYLEPKLPTAAE